MLVVPGLLVEEEINNCSECQIYTIFQNLLGPMPNKAHVLVVQVMLTQFPAAKIVLSTATKPVLGALNQIYSEYQSITLITTLHSCQLHFLITQNQKPLVIISFIHITRKLNQWKHEIMGMTIKMQTASNKLVTGAKLAALRFWYSVPLKLPHKFFEVTTISLQNVANKKHLIAKWGKP